MLESMPFVRDQMPAWRTTLATQWGSYTLHYHPYLEAYSAGCRGPWSFNKALAHWKAVLDNCIRYQSMPPIHGSGYERAMIFVYALRNHRAATIRSKHYEKN